MIHAPLNSKIIPQVGIYPLTWCFQTLYHTVPAAHRKPPSSVLAAVQKFPPTGTDEHTSMLLTFPAAPGPAGTSKHTAHGIALTNFRVATDPDGFNTARPAIRIQGTKGEVQVDGPAFRPTVWRFIQAEADRDPQVVKKGRNEEGVKEVVCEIPGHGMFWEADECARCLRDVSGDSPFLFFRFFPFLSSFVLLLGLQGCTLLCQKKRGGKKRNDC